MKAKTFFKPEELILITDAIREAELNTSGEIRVHVESSCKGDVLDRAAHIFQKLKMHKTALRNGVLFYFAAMDKKFAILGDIGINAKVSPDFWNDVKEIMKGDFAKGNLTEGLVQGILMAGQHLKLHFPHSENDVNELPDEVSFGK
ncbi:MAG: TPM domain-containing protein [Bacteroidia bacterium]|nr:TPM domain-containing protein [Bacteroidia bacterium]